MPYTVHITYKTDGGSLEGFVGPFEQKSDADLKVAEVEDRPDVAGVVVEES